MASALAKLGYAYAEQALTRSLDSGDHTIGVSGIKVSARAERNGGDYSLAIEISDGDSTIEMPARTARDVHEVMLGIIACDLQTDIDPLKSLVESRAELVEVLRAAKIKLAVFREHSGDEYQGGMEYKMLVDRIDAALSKFPAKA